MLIFRFTLKSEAPRIGPRVLFVLLPSGQVCPVEETNQMSRKTDFQMVLYREWKHDWGTAISIISYAEFGGGGGG